MSASGSGQTKVVEILLQHRATVDMQQKVSTSDTVSSSVCSFVTCAMIWHVLNTTSKSVIQL